MRFWVMGLLVGSLLLAEESDQNRRRIKASYELISPSVKVAYIDADRALELLQDKKAVTRQKFISTLQRLVRDHYFIAAISRRTPKSDADRKMLDSELFGLQYGAQNDRAAIHYYDYVEHGTAETTLALHLQNQLQSRYPDSRILIDSARSMVVGTSYLKSFAKQMGYHFVPGERLLNWPEREVPIERSLAVIDCQVGSSDLAASK